MAWIKRDTPMKPLVEETPAAIEVKEEPAAEAESATEAAPAPSRRRTKRGLRRGRHTTYTVIGLLVLFFAVIGVIATIAAGMRTVRKLRDTSHLAEEMYYTLLPLAQYAPTAFETVDEADQAPLIQAALYKITFREFIRGQQEAGYVTPYTTDEFGRTVVPVAAVTEAYHALFGDDFTPKYTTFGYEGDVYFSCEYDAEKKEYHVPQTSAGAFEHTIGTIQRAGDVYTVQVGYVHLQDVTVDDHGNKVVDIEKATYFQYYTVEHTEDDRFVIRAVIDETKNEKK